MRIQTFSVVVGTKACNAKCPFCVSRMTGFEEVTGRHCDINEANFAKACRLAQIAGTTTVLMTGKGEPTLYPKEVTAYLKALKPWNFPFIELQTNAILLGQIAENGESDIADLDLRMLKEWHRLGLNTIAISAVSHLPDHNREIYGKKYGYLSTTIPFLKAHGFTVRLCVMMHQGATDSPDDVDDVISFCKGTHVDQLTFRPIRQPAAAQDEDASDFVRTNGLTREQEAAITDDIRRSGTRLLSLMHGAEVYDIDGQNVCLTDCLTVDASGEDVRTLIFYSDGRLCYDWQYDGAVLLGGKPNDAK